MKKVKHSRSRNIPFEITEQDYQDALAAGIEPEYALKPGRYVGRRGGFLERHPEFDSAKVETKVQVTLYLDADVFKYFKEHAAQPNAAPYETQINDALRAAIARGNGTNQQAALLADEDFIRAVAERVKAISSKRK